MFISFQESTAMDFGLGGGVGASQVDNLLSQDATFQGPAVVNVGRKSAANDSAYGIPIDGLSFTDMVSINASVGGGEVGSGNPLSQF